MKAEVITIGDELLRGEIVDSNKSFLSDRLLGLDIETRFHTSVRDDPPDMVDAFRRAAARSDVVLVSGGLGPTRDDLTTEVLAQTFGRKLVLDEAALASIVAFFRAAGREMTENNAKQAWFPEGAEVLSNPIGTAPGFLLRQTKTVPAHPGVPDEAPPQAAGGRAQRASEAAGRAASERSPEGLMQARAAGAQRASEAAGRAASERSPEVWFFCMPGVPRELVRMMDEQVLPRLARRQGEAAASGAGAPVVRAALLRTFGVGESTLDAELADVAASGDPDLSLGFRTSFPENLLRPLARGRSAEEAEARLARLCSAIRERLGPLVYGEGDETLPRVVSRLLSERGATVAAAEACTGGLLAELLTREPGSAAWFRGGAVACADAAGAEQLGVPANLWARHGPVSEQTASAMAEAARARTGADFGLATVGADGPEGASPEPGLVCLALARDAGTHAARFALPLDRTRQRLLVAHTALDWVRRALLGVELSGPQQMRRRGGGAPPGR